MKEPRSSGLFLFIPILGLPFRLFQWQVHAELHLWLTPFIEIGGLLYVITRTALGWFSAFLLEEIFLIYWIVGIVLNIVALSVEALTRGHYKNRKTLLKLSFFPILEPLFCHWINSFIYELANFKLIILRKKGWGKMDRVGLTKAPPAALSVPIPSHFREKVH